MRLTPEEIEARRFRLAPNGYECEAVDRFLAEITEALRNQPAGRTENDEFSRVGQEIAGLLRAARDSAGAVRAEADGLAASVRSRAELEAADIRKEAEAHLEPGQAGPGRRRGPGRGGVREAERQTAEAVAEAGPAARPRPTPWSPRPRPRSNEILRSERSAQQRLLSARRDLQQAIDRLSGDPEQPVLDLTDQPRLHAEAEPVVADGATPTDEPSRTPGAGGTSGVGGHVDESTETEAAADPLLRMVRATVGRAAEHSGGTPADPSATAV